MNSNEKFYKPLERLRNCQSLREYQLGKQIDFKYIWQSSIPESWTKIMEKRNIHRLQLLKQSRNTLDFLTETQKYISKICMPTKSKDQNIIPTVHKTLCKPPVTPYKNLELPVRRGSSFIRPHIFKSQLSISLRQVKSQMTTPVSSEKQEISEKFKNN